MKSHQDDNHPALEPITPLQQAFITHLLTGKNITQAAHLAGISRRTATYWMADGESPVCREYSRQKSFAEKELADRVAKINSLAFDALEDMLAKTTPPFIRMQALKLLFEAQLAPLFKVRHPQSPTDLVKNRLAQQRHDEEIDGFSNVHLWDDRGHERLLDDE